jgi:hypothetical protein
MGSIEFNRNTKVKQTIQKLNFFYEKKELLFRAKDLRKLN